MPSPRRSNRGELPKDAFARILEKEERQCDGEEGQHSADCAVVRSQGRSSEDTVGDLYRQHSLQQSMEGG